MHKRLQVQVSKNFGVDFPRKYQLKFSKYVP
jgi:hypothetical protein